MPSRKGSLEEPLKAKSFFSKWLEDTNDYYQQIFTCDYHKNQLDACLLERIEA